MVKRAMRILIVLLVVTVLVLGGMSLIKHKKQELAAAPKYGVQPTPVRVAAARRGGLAAQHVQQLDDALKRSPQARLVTTDHNGYVAYRQLKLMGPDDTFRGAEPTLIKRVEGWLKKHS